MIGLFMPIVKALKVGLARTYSSGTSWQSSTAATSASRRCSRAKLRSSARTEEPSSISRTERSLTSPDRVLSSVSKPLSFRSATSAPLSAGCSHARELMPGSTVGVRAGCLPPEVRRGVRVVRHAGNPHTRVKSPDSTPAASSARIAAPSTTRYGTNQAMEWCATNFSSQATLA